MEPHAIRPADSDRPLPHRTSARTWGDGARAVGARSGARPQRGIKLLRDDLDIPPEQHDALLHRMRQEARASARVSHPNIVALHDMGEDPSLGLCLVFEYAEGPHAQGAHCARDRSAPRRRRSVAREVGDALTTAHLAGVLHRDIKPENIILTSTGAKVCRLRHRARSGLHAHARRRAARHARLQRARVHRNRQIFAAQRPIFVGRHLV